MSSFSDDYRLTAAINIVKWVVQRYENGNTDEKPNSNKEPSPDQGHGTPKTASSTRLTNAAGSRAAPRNSAASRTTSRASTRTTSNVIPVKALTLALEACRDFLRYKEHLDIDEPINKVCILEIVFTQCVESCDFSFCGNKMFCIAMAKNQCEVVTHNGDIHLMMAN